MTTTTHKAPRGFARHLWTWVEAIALLYLAAFAMLLVGGTVALGVRGSIELMSWVAGLAR